MTGSARGVAFGALVVAIGLAIAQTLGYALNVVGARYLGPDGFGAFASLLSILVIGSVVGGGFQAVGARRLVLSATTQRRGQAATILRITLWSALVVSSVTLAISPLLQWLLHINGWFPVALTALALIPVTVAGAQYAITQGREDFGRLATMYALVGLGKAAGGIAGALIWGTLLGAMWGLTLGSMTTMLIGLVVLRPVVTKPAQALPGFIKESLHATHALGALFVLTNVDIILARVLLSPEQAGLYAVGSIVAKIAFWLPQFVGVVAFPRMADHRRDRATKFAVLSVGVMGAVTVAGTAIFAPTIIGVIGGAEYVALGPILWLFAAAGSMYAVGQAVLLSRIAQGDRRAVIAVWIAAGLLGAIALVWARSVTGLVLCACAAGAALCVTSLVVLLRESSSARDYWAGQADGR